jgi:hypothetical protein
MVVVTRTKTLYLRGNAAFWKAAGGRQNGATLARRLADTASDISFSRFDRVASIKAPHGAISLEQLGGGSGTTVSGAF